MVFCGLFPIDTDRYSDLRDALEKLALNDASLSYEPETSQALGFGFRCGFLGLLHMDIVRERLEREYDLELLATTPNVEYHVRSPRRRCVEVHSPTDMPDPTSSRQSRSPTSARPSSRRRDFVGPIMELCQDRRGTHVGHALPLRAARAAALRPAAGRDRARLLRPAQVAQPRLRVARLRADRLPRVRPREARHPARRRPGRRAVAGRPQGQGLRRRARRSSSACGRRSRASCTRSRSRRRSARASSPARRSSRCART